MLERHLPGLTDDLVAAGGLRVAAERQLRMHLSGGWLCRPQPKGRSFVNASRPLIESVVRRRVDDLPNVTIRAGVDVRGLVVEGRRVTGVRILARRPGSAVETLHGDLVVDTTGRGSRMPIWLQELGYPAPTLEAVDIGVRYAARHYRREPHHLDGHREMLISAIPSGRGGVLHAIEDDQWLVGLIGYLGDAPPADPEGFTAFAASLDVPELHDLIVQAEPVSDITTATFPASQRRRYDRLDRFPDGLVVLGDALCSFNPTYAQGMSVAAVEADLLGEILDTDATRQVGRRFFARSRATVDAAWDLSLSTDLELEGVDGHRTPVQRLLDRYGQRVARVAQRDPVVCAAFYEVLGMTGRPEALLAPRIAVRVLRPGAAPAPRDVARTPRRQPIGAR